MERAEVIQYISQLPGTSYDCPFREDFDATALRHGYTRKWFGLIMRVAGRHVGRTDETELLNLKAPPELIPLLVETHPFIIPSYHMNKKHWISVILPEAPAETVKQLISLSYDLTDGKRGKI